MIELHVHKPVFADVHGRIDLYSGDKLFNNFRRCLQIRYSVYFGLVS